MRVLYASFRHSPLDISAGSGADYQLLTAIINGGHDVRILGPFRQSGTRMERAVNVLYRTVTQQTLLKFPLSVVRQVSEALNTMEREWHPDVVFTMFPVPLAFYSGTAPCVYRIDAPYRHSYLEYPQYGHSPQSLFLTDWLQKRALRRSAKVVTHSEWCRDLLISDYHLKPEQITWFPNAAALPAECVPSSINIEIEKNLSGTIRLLFVGRDPHRKGLDIAIETTKLLNESGSSAHLMVCGCEGENSKDITYKGIFNKADAEDLLAYTSEYKYANFLLHPARFDPSPIVVSEAAAFATPTLTNDVAGMSTAVKDQESGIVLPRGSKAADYANAILQTISDPLHYFSLCFTTRRRYETDMNWGIAGQRLNKVLNEVVRYKDATNH